MMDKIQIQQDPAFQSLCTNLSLNYRNMSTCKNAIFVYANADHCLIFDKKYDFLGEDIPIKSDRKLQKSKMSYDLDFYLFSKVIVLETPKKGIYFLLDRNFNRFDIIHSSLDEELLRHTSTMQYLLYTRRFEEYLPGYFPAFADFSTEIILNIADRIQNIYKKSNVPFADGSEDFHVTINKVDYTLNSSNQKFKMLCFIKYLGEIAEYYFQGIYPLMAVDVLSSVPALGDYLNRIAKEIYKSLKQMDEQNPISSADRLITRFGHTEEYDKLRTLVELTCMLMTECSFDIVELTALANACFHILDVPDEEYRHKRNTPYIQKSEADFEELFSNVEAKRISLWHYA